MKTKAYIIALSLASVALCGCASLPAKLEEFSKLGFKEIEVTGKFSTTHYRVEETDTKRTETLDHSNTWTPKVHIVRETAK